MISRVVCLRYREIGEESMLFDGDIEKTIVATAVVAWFAHGWYLNERLKLVHEKLDLVLEQFHQHRE